jgi:hypothetical protein
MDKEILDFIQGSFKSIWSLELMVFMLQHRDRAWGNDELVRELRGSGPVVTQSLTMLQAAGLVIPEADEKFRYAPASPALDQLAMALERIHREMPTSVHRAILSAPNEKLYTLADAFRIKKD